MIIIEKNLEQLTKQYDICDKDLIDDFSLRIRLGRPHHIPKESHSTIIYGQDPDPSEFFSPLQHGKQNITVGPGKQFIACSKDIYKMPSGYFGLLQTKGTLARLFVSTTCNDGQIEPGFHGYVTLEIVNHSPWTIELPIGSEVAQLYLIKCSSEALRPYKGRYAEGALKGPTLAFFP